MQRQHKFALASLEYLFTISLLSKSQAKQDTIELTHCATKAQSLIRSDWKIMSSSSKQTTGWRLVADNEEPKKPAIDLPDHEAIAIIGRDKNCDITLPDTHLSRQHAQLGVWDGQLHIKDLNSTNGTFINGRRIVQGCANPGDQVRFHIYSFTLQGPGEHYSPKPPNTKQNKPSYRDPERPKKWKLAPTSPGNREEPTYDQPKIKPLTLISIILCIGMLGLLAYLLLNA